MSRVPLLDYAFLAFETDNSPKHVGGIQVYELPAGASDDFVGELVARTKRTHPQPPFDQRLHTPIGGLPRWQFDDEYEADDYVFHECLGEPGTMAELLERVADVHARKVDRTGPLWEIHFFEGLDEGRFAIYFKVHHAYMDGISLSSMAMAALTETPEDPGEISFWGKPAAEGDDAPRDSRVTALAATAAKLTKLALSMPALARVGLMHGLRLAGLSGHELPIPFTAPRTLFNAPVTRRRELCVATLSLERLRNVAEHAGVTINDVVLELVDSAMSRYLEDHDAAPAQPLVAQMPISLRRDGLTQGNQITIALLELGAEHDDPVRRLQHIHAHASSVKREFRSMPAEAAEAYTVLLQTASQLAELTGLDQHLPPLGNVLVSNLAGPEGPRFLAGARLQAVFPVSTIAPGLAINITCYSYNGGLHVGVVTGASEIPDLDDLVDHIASALPALEVSMGLGRAARRRGKSTKPARKKAKGKKAKSKKVARKPAAKKKTSTRATKPRKTRPGRAKLRAVDDGNTKQ
ncbi:MAG: wax ester/triacylglycerol synthase family O-acyltransferase [Pseudomonadota bacterium]